MEVGSLVVCINDSEIPSVINGIKSGEIYTATDIAMYGKGLGICVEECSKLCDIEWEVKVVSVNHKIPYSVNRFRELDTPVSIDVEELLIVEAL